MALKKTASLNFTHFTFFDPYRIGSKQGICPVLQGGITKAQSSEVMYCRSSSSTIENTAGLHPVGCIRAQNVLNTGI